MRFKYGSVLAAALVMLVPPVVDAQDAARAVAGGGITAKGWTGKVDANEEKAGQTLNNAKLAQEGNALKATTGPAVAYWNPANKAAGNYTVKATFTEEKFMGLNDHAHPYGIVIAGNDLGTPQQSRHGLSFLPARRCGGSGSCALPTSWERTFSRGG